MRPINLLDSLSPAGRADHVMSRFSQGESIGRLRCPDVVIEHVCTYPDNNDFIDICYGSDLPRAPH